MATKTLAVAAVICWPDQAWGAALELMEWLLARGLRSSPHGPLRSEYPCVTPLGHTASQHGIWLFPEQVIREGAWGEAEVSGYLASTGAHEALALFTLLEASQSPAHIDGEEN